MTMNSSPAAVTGKGLNLPQRMERLPLTRYQHKTFLIIATAWLFDSMYLGIMTFVLAPISKTFALTQGQAGLMGSSSLAGMAVGASLAGMLADRIGRRPVFQVSMIMWGLAALLCAIAPSYTFLLWARFILGFGIGGRVSHCSIHGLRNYSFTIPWEIHVPAGGLLSIRLYIGRYHVVFSNTGRRLEVGFFYKQYSRCLCSYNQAPSPGIPSLV